MPAGSWSEIRRYPCRSSTKLICEILAPQTGSSAACHPVDPGVAPPSPLEGVASFLPPPSMGPPSPEVPPAPPPGSTRKHAERVTVARSWDAKSLFMALVHRPEESGKPGAWLGSRGCERCLNVLREGHG